MNNFNDYTTTYQPMGQSNMYIPPTQAATPVYPKNWQQYYQQPMTNNMIYQSQMQPMNNPMVWVQGEAGAKSYQLPNNTTLPLWDSEQQTIYIKTVDQNGKPTMTILDYVDRNAPAASNDTDKVAQVEYATKEQVDGLSNQFSAISEKLNMMSEYVTRDQFDDLNDHIKDLGGQINDIEDRITSFGKPQSGNNYNNKRGNK